MYKYNLKVGAGKVNLADDIIHDRFLRIDYGKDSTTVYTFEELSDAIEVYNEFEANSIIIIDDNFSHLI